MIEWIWWFFFEPEVKDAPHVEFTQNFEPMVVLQAVSAGRKLRKVSGLRGLMCFKCSHVRNTDR
jgi:hypothetical protein